MKRITLTAILAIFLTTSCGGGPDSVQIPEFEPPDFKICTCDTYSCWGDCNHHPHIRTGS